MPIQSAGNDLSPSGKQAMTTFRPTCLFEATDPMLIIYIDVSAAGDCCKTFMINRLMSLSCIR